MKRSPLLACVAIMISLVVLSTAAAESVSADSYYGIVMEGGFDGQRKLDKAELSLVLDILAVKSENESEKRPKMPPEQGVIGPSPRPTVVINVYNAPPVMGGKYSPEDKVMAQLLYFAEAGLVTCTGGGKPKVQWNEKPEDCYEGQGDMLEKAGVSVIDLM